MWLVLLGCLFVAAAIHARFSKTKRAGGAAEIFLVYLLAGYCGIAQILEAAAILIAPDHIAAHLGIPSGNPMMMWMGFMYLGAAFIGTLAIWFRGRFLLGPVVVWSTFWAGATYAHLHLDAVNGQHQWIGSVAWIFATHGLNAVLLITLYWLTQRTASQSVARPVNQ